MLFNAFLDVCLLLYWLFEDILAKFPGLLHAWKGVLKLSKFSRMSKLL